MLWSFLNLHGMKNFSMKMSPERKSSESFESNLPSKIDFPPIKLLLGGISKLMLKFA